ncbi:MAG: hypothetical protein J0H46_07255 [Bacteroidetes bacterium]|uniref:hypothetical protein n=1 Tax=uncultured Dysgonomonas sp. TaxID=206096 RepID=UPI001ACA80E4|nr:hypothetical protein [uncultured Dysgonomonas sp.]MBN9483133.1 hypothetical protein [Bacteroidota bacterium]
MLKAIKSLTRWKQNIDDRLYNEGYKLRDGKPYTLDGEYVDATTYHKRRKHR